MHAKIIIWDYWGKEKKSSPLPRSKQWLCLNLRYLPVLVFPISFALRTNCLFSLACLQLTQLRLFSWQYSVLFWFWKIIKNECSRVIAILDRLWRKHKKSIYNFQMHGLPKWTLMGSLQLRSVTNHNRLNQIYSATWQNCDNFPCFK